MHLDAIIIAGILTIIGGILIVAGFLSPSLHMGHVVGVKTPWTDRSDRSRTRTNRAGAVCFLVLGLLTLLLGMAGVPNAHLVGVYGLIAVTVLLMPYSYLEWWRDPAREKGKGITRLFGANARKDKGPGESPGPSRQSTSVNRQ